MVDRPGQLVTSENINASQNTRGSALYHTNLSCNWMAYVKLNSEYFILNDFSI